MLPAPGICYRSPPPACRRGRRTGPQIGVHLALQIAGQEAQPLPCLHRRAGEDDAVDLLVPEGGHGGGHRQVGLAGARRADAQGDGVLLDGVHIPFLAQVLGLMGLPLAVTQSTSRAMSLMCSSLPAFTRLMM